MPYGIDLKNVMLMGREACAREAIHTPGGIQPHGLLVGLDRVTLAVRTKSANLDDILPATPYGEPPPWLPPAVAEACRDLDGEHTLPAEVPGLGATEVHCFTAGEMVFCEVEAPWPAGTPRGGADALFMAGTVGAIADAADLPALAAATAEAVRAISGFERVMVYRFHADGDDGEVVGESLAEDWRQSFLGLRFPASDIPAQARALYQVTSERWVPTRDYEPVPLLPDRDEDGRALDLSLSRFRSVSPIHRAYQRNIGADGAMSISVLRNGRLWGLVIGHHRRPHRVAAMARHQATAVVQSFAMRLDALVSAEEKAELEQDMHGYSAMLRKLAAAEDYISALTEGEPDITGLLPGCCGAAVVLDDGTVRSLGQVAPATDLAALAAWIRAGVQGAVFATDTLSQAFPSFAAHQAVASGLLACRFDDARHPVLLLFRPEVVQMVAWAGKPEKAVGPDGIPNLPRQSFDRWTETRRGQSVPWREWEVDIAATIAATVNDVIVRQAGRIRDLDIEVGRFAQALDLSGTTLYRQDTDLRYLWIHNPNAGFAPKAVGLSDHDIYDPDLAERIVAVKRRVLATGAGERVAIPSHRDDPQAEWYDLSVEPLVRDGGITGLSCAAVRITERKRNEDALRHSEALLREVQRIARLGHYTYDIAADRWESSPVLESILGIGAGFVRDYRNGLTLVADGAAANIEALAASLLSGERDSFDIPLRVRRHDDGRELWVQSTGYLERDGAGRPLRLIGTVHDINDLVEAERKLREAHDDLDRQARELARSNEELTQFAHLASHDLREPLRMVSGYLNLLRRELSDRLGAREQELFTFAIDGAKRMDRLIVGLLDYARIGRDAAFESIGLDEIVGDALANLRIAIQEAEAVVSVAGPLPVVSGDRLELTRLFQNLIGNALKYRAPDRVPAVTISCHDHGETWLIRVADNGIGIAPEDRERAFGIFQRLVGREIEGTGIGLAACRKIVEQHGGRIWIESEPGQGATFLFTLLR